MIEIKVKKRAIEERDWVRQRNIFIQPESYES